MTVVCLGFDSIADYQNIPSDFGASIGRYICRKIVTNTISKAGRKACSIKCMKPGNSTGKRSNL